MDGVVFYPFQSQPSSQGEDTVPPSLTNATKTQVGECGNGNRLLVKMESMSSKGKSCNNLADSQPGQIQVKPHPHSGGSSIFYSLGAVLLAVTNFSCITDP